MCSPSLCEQLAKVVATETMPSNFPPGIATMSTWPPLNDHTPSISELAPAEAALAEVAAEAAFAEAALAEAATAEAAPAPSRPARAIAKIAHRAGRTAWRIRLIDTPFRSVRSCKAAAHSNGQRLDGLSGDPHRCAAPRRQRAAGELDERAAATAARHAHDAG